MSCHNSFDLTMTDDYFERALPKFPFAVTAVEALESRRRVHDGDIAGVISERARQDALFINTSLTRLFIQEITAVEECLGVDFGLFMASRVPGVGYERHIGGRKVPCHVIVCFMVDVEGGLWLAECLGPGGAFVEAVTPALVYKVTDSITFGDCDDNDLERMRLFVDVDATETDARRQEIAAALAPILAPAVARMRARIEAMQAVAEAEAEVSKAMEVLCAKQATLAALEKASA